MSLRDQRGEFTIVGLIVAMSLFIVVLGATLDIFASSERNTQAIQKRNDALDRSRVTVDLLSRQLRNMASPTPEQPQSIDRASDTDVVFQTVDSVGPNPGTNTANVQRVRYCLDGSGQLWRQNQRWTGTPPAAPADGGGANTAGGCPSGAWDDQRVVAEEITNYVNGLSRPVFTFGPAASPLTSITRVHVDLWLDLDSARTPPEVTLSSGVYLRNQNRRPTAALSFTPSVNGIILNGSGSQDPEGDPLRYCWYDTALPHVSSPPAPCDAGPFLGSGVTILDPVPSGATRDVYLVVKDPALLSDQTPTTTVHN